MGRKADFARFAAPAVTGMAPAALLFAERASPLRRRTVSQAPRLVRNTVMGVLCQAVIALAERPLTHRIARHNAARGRGVQHLIARQLGRRMGPMAALLVMDYTFYLWHVATHKLPFLWRFHIVHHADPDLDASTAIRFHFADMLVSLPCRLAQVRLAGLDPVILAHWQFFFFASIAFHHSNWRMPGNWDRRLAWVFTTPAMHGTHHSRDPAQMNSNWSSGFSIWDRLHATLRQDAADEPVAIGIASRDGSQMVRLAGALAAPLVPARVPTGGAPHP